MLLLFTQYRAKLYAETPAGEYQFGDATGLNEWRNGRRTRYTGGDQQGAKNGRLLQLETNPDTYRRGWEIALIPYIRPTN